MTRGVINTAIHPREMIFISLWVNYFFLPCKETSVIFHDCTFGEMRVGIYIMLPETMSRLYESLIYIYVLCITYDYILS